MSLIVALFGQEADAGPPRSPPPKVVLHQLELRSAEGQRRQVQFGAPEGWTPLADTGPAERELVGPDGEGRMLVFARLEPSQLGPVLDRLRAEHPSAAPSPPEKLDLPGLRPPLGERATRFSITGREAGELVMIERDDTIVLIVTVVAPSAWPALAPRLARTYPLVAVRRLR